MKFLLLSTHRLLHRLMHDDDPVSNSHKQLLQFEAGGFQVPALLAVKHKECRRTHSQGSPSDIHGIRLSDNPSSKGLL